MFLPRTLQNFLEKSRLYLYLRYRTPLYKLWLLARKDVRKQMDAKRRFYEKLLPEKCDLIFDIGANEGMMTNLFAHLSHRVIAIEPADRNLRILKAKFYKKKTITIVPFAVSNINGEQLWYPDNNNYAMGTLSQIWNDLKAANSAKSSSQTFVKTLTLDFLLQQFGMPDYVKIDVEGNELQVLSGLSQPIPMLSFEAILPQFLRETLQCIEVIFAIATTRFNYSNQDEFAYPRFVNKDQLIKDIKNLNYTIDIFCKTD